MKYKMNRGQLNDLLGLLHDLKEDLSSVNPDVKYWHHDIDNVMGYVIDQMNRIAGNNLATEQKNLNAPTGWLGQQLDEERCLSKKD